MVFRDISFIKPNGEFPQGFTQNNIAPRFRKKILIDDFKTAKLYVCGLGYGYYYINGAKVSEDLFTAPVSDYTKTLWYNTYDVSGLLKKGENVIAVWCGNGWYNEEFGSSWNYDKAKWRDVPKFILRLDIDGKKVLQSDETWLCKKASPIWFNALRSGEYYDCTKVEQDWNRVEYDDSGWETAAIDDTPPEGSFRECKCEPIRELEVFDTKRVIQTGEKRYVFDIGQNISGYIRLSATGRKGQPLVIRYAELIDAENKLQTNKMEKHFPESDFQTDKIVLSGERTVWSPMFCYHGFRYIEIDGIENIDDVSVKGVFVHQAVAARTEFECSDDFLNKLFKAGQMASYSNMFYMLTDCPTREKLGWCNDAQSSIEQMLTNFETERLLEKWLTDIYDAMREDGALPGIVPTSGWGFEWGNGPVSDGILFEIPYRIYVHTGNKEPLVASLPYFEKYLRYLDRRADDSGWVHFGLPDWCKPGREAESDDPDVPVEFVNAVLMYKFYNIAELAAKLASKSGNDKAERSAELKKRIKRTFINAKGECTISQQTAVAMLIYYDLYDNIKVLRDQLKELIEKNGFHHDCGMVGMRRLLYALNKCGLEEYAYKVITVDGCPGYRDWLDNGATTLWEFWNWKDNVDSKNHHMFSDVMSWIVKTISGVRIAGKDNTHLDIKPYFFKELKYAKCRYRTLGGDVSVEWKRDKDIICLSIFVPDGVEAVYAGQKLVPGRMTGFKICEG